MKRFVRNNQEARFEKSNNNQKSHMGKYIIIGFIFLILFIFIFMAYLTRDLPSLKQLENYDPELATKIYSRDGVLIKEFFTKKRILKPLEEMPEYLVQAALATEDRNFYDHWGLDFKRIIKAIIIDIIHMRYKEGASTITQQLARQLYLNLEKSMVRKLREIITAIQIERTYTKHEILEMYLNHMYFGHGAYGVQTASMKFFNKDASQLNIEECALLVGILQRPNAYSPYRHRDRALSRRNIVLFNMYTQGYITKEDYDRLKSKPIMVNEKNRLENVGIAPYFTEHIRQELQTNFGMELYTGGYNIYTTLDSRIQACADSAVNKNIKNFKKNLIPVL